MFGAAVGRKRLIRGGFRDAPERTAKTSLPDVPWGIVALATACRRPQCW